MDTANQGVYLARLQVDQLCAETSNHCA